VRKVEGVVIGLVKEIDAAQAQVKLEFPWLQSSYRSNWAPIATPMSGNNRGLFMMPEQDDEVLVAFRQGNMDHPYVIGFLWNGIDKAPEDGTGASVRRLRTVSGHVLEFDDRTGKERVLIKTQGGHEIEMKDTPGAAQVNIKTSGGQEVTLQDAPSSVTASIASGNKVSIDMTGITAQISTGVSVTVTPIGVTISAPSGVVALNCLQASINAASILSVNAPIAQFSGVVQATTIVAAAYTPAPGNTFGL
jgi:uncharacterized protein involved in type VI secretion and phage assembly